MRKSFLLRCAACCLLAIMYSHMHAQVPELKINDQTDPNVYLSKLSIDVKVVGNRAITNMTMVFTNKSNPGNAAIPRYKTEFAGERNLSVHSHAGYQ